MLYKEKLPPEDFSTRPKGSVGNAQYLYFRAVLLSDDIILVEDK